MTSLKHHNGGFTIIEVMVSVVLLAGGLLSVAYMQTYALQFGQESYHRGQTLISANEIIESMRVNRIASDGGATATYTDVLTTSESTAGCDVTSGDPRNQVVCFYEELDRTLPFGTARIQVNPTDNRYFDITVFWIERGLSQQADLSDPDVANANLTTPADCNAEDNRAWAATIAGQGVTWPFVEAPATPPSNVCLASHTWSVQILDPASI